MQKISHQTELFDLRCPRVGTYEVQMAYIARLPECHRPIHILMRELALRLSEVCALKISDLDIPNRRIMIGRAVSADVRYAKVRKTSWIPLSDMALEIANAALAGRPGEQLLFINPVTGKGYRPSFLWKLHQRFGFPRHLKLHELFRFTTIADWARIDQMSPYAIKELARHSNVRSALRHAWVAIEDLHQLVNRKLERKP